MAISPYGMKIIKQAIDTIFKKKNSCNILALGYPDMLLTKKDFKNWLTKNQINELETRINPIDIAAMHNKKDVANWCAESYSVFEQFGCNLTVADFAKWEGKEEIIDLNYPIDDKYKNKYDLILDPGTTEHIFNIPQAMINILFMTKKGGFIYHATPFNIANHGFYSLSPTFYEDFYSNNGAEIINCFLSQFEFTHKDIELPKTEIINITNGANSILVKKNKKTKKITYPIQFRYTNSMLDTKKISKKYKNLNTIALIPYNGHTRYLKNILKDKQISIFDDSEILNGYLDIKPIVNINSDDYDVILITSPTFTNKIKQTLIELGVPKKKIKTQY